MDTTRLPQDFREFLQLLNARTVEYILVGGWAVGYHGYVRATANIDVWIASTPSNASKLVEVLREFGFNGPDITPGLFLLPDRIVRLGNPPFRIELLTTISGVTFEQGAADSLLDDLDGVPVRIIGLAQLRLNKKASGRLKDLVDLQHLPDEGS